MPHLAQFFNKKIVQNLDFSVSEAALFPRKLASNFLFFYFFYSIFVLDPGPNPVRKPEL